MNQLSKGTSLKQSGILTSLDARRAAASEQAGSTLRVYLDYPSFRSKEKPMNYQRVERGTPVELSLH